MKLRSQSRKECSGTRSSCVCCDNDSGNTKKKMNSSDVEKASTSEGNSPSTSAGGSLLAPLVVSRKKQCLTCAICLDIYTEPKILPCFHTFCRHCLENLPTEQAGWLYYDEKIACPTCRKRVIVPPGGVSQFQTNFHIISEELEKLKEGRYCSVHPDKEMDLYCADCHVPACTKCMLSDHKQHNFQDMAEVAGREQLLKDRERLKRTASQIEADLAGIQQNQESVPKKRRALEDIIEGRYRTLKAAMDMVRDEVVVDLVKMADSISDRENQKLQREKERLEEVDRLQQRVEQALEAKESSEVITVATELKSGSAGKQILLGLTEEKTTVCTPVLHFSSSPSAMLRKLREYFGRPATQEIAVSSPEMMVELKLQCWLDRDISHVCPLTDGKVWVSYEPDRLELGAFSQLHDADGKILRTIKSSEKGNITWVRRKNGKAMVVKPAYGSVSTFAKKVGYDMSYFFRLNSFDDRDLSTIQKTSVTCENPLMTERSKVCKVQHFTGFTRALDFSSDETMFVVLAETREGWPNGYRSSTLRLYDCAHSESELTYSIATYSPAADNPSRPPSSFLLSDACFYKLGGREVLLVADERSDAIHVVNIVEKRLKFSHYLLPVPGSPQLVQPLALNTDAEGRLWVACRGGKVFVCTPVSD